MAAMNYTTSQRNFHSTFINRTILVHKLVINLIFFLNWCCQWLSIQNSDRIKEIARPVSHYKCLSSIVTQHRQNDRKFSWHIQGHAYFIENRQSVMQHAALKYERVQDFLYASFIWGIVLQLFFFFVVLFKCRIKIPVHVPLKM